jgi:hypothetical protein
MTTEILDPSKRSNQIMLDMLDFYRQEDDDQPLPINNATRSMIDYVMTHGRFYTPAKRPRDVRQRRPGTCYSSAARYVRHHDGLIYVEGFAFACDCCHGSLAFKPFRHAWAVTPKDEVIDLTWKHTDHCAYFGVPFVASDTAGLARAGRLGEGWLEWAMHREAA